MDLGFITFFLRWSVAAIILACGWRILKISKSLNNLRLTRTTKRAGWILVTFFIVRNIAAIIDWYMPISIGIFSYLVTYAFWVWFFVYLTKQHHFINSEKVGTEGRQKISTIIEDLAFTIEEMKQIRDKIKTEG